MKEYEEFVFQILDRMRREFPEYEIAMIGGHINVRKEGTRTGVRIRLQDAWNLEKDKERLADSIIEHLRDYLVNMPTFDTLAIDNWEKAKTKLFTVLERACPDIDVAEDFLIFKRCVRLKVSEGYTARVTKEIAEKWGQTEEEVLAAAKKNEVNMRPATVVNAGFLAIQLDEEMPEGMDDVMQIISTEDGYMGAECIAYPGILEGLEKLYGGDFVIIPSSIHECIALPMTDKESIIEMMKSANNEIVAPEEILADIPLRWNSWGHRLEVY